MNKSDIQQFPFAEMDVFMKIINNGDSFIQIVRELKPCKAKEMLQMQGILSILVIPILIEKKCWGFIGLDECKFERKWPDAEISLITTFVNSVTRIIEQGIFEQKLIESEERYKRITEGITDYLYTVKVENGKAVETIHNSGCLPVTGYTSFEFEQDPYLWINMVVPEERNLIAHRFSEILKGKNLQNTIEHRIICKDGKIKWVSDTTIPKHGENGQIEWYDGVIKDITERMLVEKALKESEEKFRLLFDTITEGVALNEIVYDENGEMVDYRILEVNKAFYLTANQSNTQVLNNLASKLYGISQEVINCFWKNHKEKNETEYSEMFSPLTNKYYYISTSPFLNDRFVTIFFDITSRKQTEKALSENEQKYRLIAENTTDVIWTFDMESKRFTYISPSMIHLTGFSAEEAIEKRIEDMIGAEYADFMMQGLTKRISNFYAGDNSEKTQINELQQICKDGSLIWVEMVSTFVLNNKGKIDYLLGISRNIQSRKKNEWKLTQSQNRYKTISRLSSDFSYSCFHGIDGYEIDWITEAFFSITGYTIQELKQQKCWLFAAHPEDRSDAISKLNQIQIGENIQLEFRIISKKGKEHTIINKMECMPDDEVPGRKRVFGAVQDISERKLAEEELKQNETRLRSLVDIFQFDIDSVNEILDLTLEKSIQLTKSKIGYIYFYDEQTKDFTLFSWSKDVMKDCKILDSRLTYQLQNTGVWGEAVRQRKPIMLNDFHAPHKLKKGYPEGHATLNKFLTVPVFSNYNIVAVAGVANKETDYNEADILHLTLLMNSVWKVIERKNMEIALKEKNRELLELNLDKDRFVSILAHDLKSPFNSILGYLNLLCKNIRKYDIDKIENQINIISSSAQNTFNLLESILMWAHTQSGKIKFEPQQLNFINVYNDIIKSLKLNAENKKIAINYSSNEEIIVFADLNMLSTVLRNLISNAIKFTNSGGQVNVYAVKMPSGIEISVQDNGVGIEPENLSKLFDYSQIYTTNGTNNEKGTGLGLVLCKEFVEKHDGKIWLQSKVGKGTEFKFTIPTKCDNKTC